MADKKYANIKDSKTEVVKMGDKVRTASGKIITVRGGCDAKYEDVYDAEKCTKVSSK